MIAAHTATAPPGLWRVGRASDPYSTKPPEPINNTDIRGGNRFDSAAGTYRVLYFATHQEACFGETLAAMRPNLKMRALVEEEWKRKGFMLVGTIPADWRHKRLLVNAHVDGVFFDIEEHSSRTYLEHQAALANILANYDVAHLDVPTVRGRDRRITRHISQWIHDHTKPDGTPTYAGIRYLSRLDTDWECWAVFDRTAVTETQRYAISARHPALKRITTRWEILIR